MSDSNERAPQPRRTATQIALAIETSEPEAK